MKQLITLTILASVMLFALAAQAQQHGNHADATTPQHTQHLSVLIGNYLQVKKALVQDDFEQAKAELSDLKEEVAESSEINNHSKHAQMHRKHHEAMMEAITAASKADNLKQFRSAFAAISEHLIKMVKNQNYNKQTLYVQFCPMAVNGKGATWLSTEKEIVNPYLGQKMPGCGETKEKIEPDK